jgi:hypothetical protein
METPLENGCTGVSILLSLVPLAHSSLVWDAQRLREVQQQVLSFGILCRGQEAAAADTTRAQYCRPFMTQLLFGELPLGKCGKLGKASRTCGGVTINLGRQNAQAATQPRAPRAALKQGGRVFFQKSRAGWEVFVVEAVGAGQSALLPVRAWNSQLEEHTAKRACSQRREWLLEDGPS